MATQDDTQGEDQELDPHLAAEVDLPDEDEDDGADEGPEQPTVRKPGEEQRPSRREQRNARLKESNQRAIDRAVTEALRKYTPAQPQGYAPPPQQRQAPAVDSDFEETQKDLSYTLNRLANPDITDEEHKYLLARAQKLEQNKAEAVLKRVMPRQAPQNNDTLEVIRYDYRDVIATPAAEERAASMARGKLAQNPGMSRYAAIKETLEEMRTAAKAASARPSAGVAARYGNTSSAAGGGGGRNTVKVTKSEVSQARSVYPKLSEEKAIAKWALGQRALEKKGLLK